MGSTYSRERTIVDAFRELVGGRIEETGGLKWKVTRLSDGKTRLTNGVAYCFAEVTFANGTQYGMEAFGDEANALHLEASTYVNDQSGQEMPLLLAQ